MSWSREFEDPIPLPGGKSLRTLREAANYIVKLSEAEQDKPHWRTAVRELMISAEQKGIIMLARIAMMQALTHGKPAENKPSRKKAPKRYRVAR